MTNYCSTEDHGGPDTGSVMTIFLGNPIVRCVLLTTGRFLETQSFLDLHAKADPTIEVEMLITLGRTFDV